MELLIPASLCQASANNQLEPLVLVVVQWCHLWAELFQPFQPHSWAPAKRHRYPPTATRVGQSPVTLPSPLQQRSNSSNGVVGVALWAPLSRRSTVRWSQPQDGTAAEAKPWLSSWRALGSGNHSKETPEEGFFTYVYKVLGSSLSCICRNWIELAQQSLWEVTGLSLNILLKMSKKKTNIIQHTENQGNLKNSLRKRQSTNTNTEMIQMLELLDKDFKATVMPFSKR